MFDEEVVFSHAFFTDGVFDCELTIENDIDYYQESWTFTVQYAIENVRFGLWDDGFITYDVLRPSSDPSSHFIKNFHFILLRDTDQPLPTNVSWTISFNAFDQHNSTDYISLSDRVPSLSNDTYEHVISWNFVHGSPGDLQAVVRLENLISTEILTYQFTVYDEVYELNIDSILHPVTNQNPFSS